MNSDECVFAKLARPALPFDHIERPRLANRLIQLCRQRLTCVCAPIGYGKTTLLTECAGVLDADWVNVKTAWLSIDALDGDSDRFWLHMRAALANLFDGERSEELFASRTLVSLSNELFRLCDDHPGNQYVLFVDGFETMESRDVEDELLDFFALLPPCLHVVMAADWLSPMMQASLYRFGRASLEARDLAFTLEEAESFLGQGGSIELPRSLVEDIVFWTEGWAQGVILAATAIARGGWTSSELPHDSMRRLVAKYFTERVFADAPEGQVECLRQLSVVESFNLDLCESLLDDENAIGYVDDVIARNLFVFPSEGALGGYRFHRLLADTLRVDLATMDDGLIRRLSMRACMWHFELGEHTQAAKYMLLASDLRYIENLAEAISHVSRSDKRESSVLWLLRTPAARMDESPVLCMMVVWSFITNARLSPAMQWVEKYKSCIAREENRLLVSEKDAEFATKCLTMKCHSMAGEAEEALVLCDELLNGDYTIEPSLMSLLYQSLGEIYERLGKMRQAQEMYLQGQAYASVDSTMHLYYFNAFSYAHMQFLMGDNDETIAQCRKSLRECPGDSALSGALGALLARALLEKNEREPVPEIIGAALQRVSPYRHADMYLEAKIAQARYLVSTGQMSEAYEVIVEASMNGENRDVPRGVMMSVYCLQAELASRRHNARDLKVLERKALPRVRSNDAYGMALMLIIRAFAARESGETELAISFFDGAIGQAKSGGLVRTQLKALVEKALTLMEMGDESHAQTVMNDVLILASRYGFLRSVLDAGEPMRALLRDRTAVRKVGEGVREYVRMLLVEFEKDAPSGFAVAEQGADVPDEDIATLTQRELEIFRLLNLGLSRQEIAESLCISVNTAKKHLANIYAKLGVSTREEAIKKFYGNPFE